MRWDCTLGGKATPCHRQRMYCLHTHAHQYYYGYMCTLILICRICRDEVSRGVAKMDKRTVETSIIAARKRLDKHFVGFAEISVSAMRL